MDETNVFLFAGFIVLIPTLMVLSATLYYYITTKKFNKYGTVTYGEIVGYEYGNNLGYDGPIIDYIFVEFELDGEKCSGTIIHNLHSYSHKALEENFAKGTKKKIKVLKNKKGHYEIRLLKENKENASYWKSIILAVIATLALLLSVCFFFEYSSYNKFLINSANNNIVKYNKNLNNPYIEKFATLNDETIESMNTKFGVQGKLENPNISQASYVWEVKAGMKIKGTINSEGKLRSVELDAQDDEFFDNSVKFADDISTLNGKQEITYEEVKAKCGGIDGNPTRISNGMANTYVWVNSEYKLIITIGSSGYVTSAILKPR